MIIDAHTHIFKGMEGSAETLSEASANLLSQLDESKADKAVLLPIAPSVPNGFISQVCSEHPDKVIGFASVLPTEGKRAVEELERAVKELALRGLKLHPRHQRFGLDQLEQVVPVVQRAADLKVPINIDAFPFIDENYLSRDLELINALAARVPEAKIIIAHCAGHRLFEAWMIASRHENVYLDISLTPLYYDGTSVQKDLVFVIKRVGPQRCMYGSDYPQMDLAVALDRTYSFLASQGFKDGDMRYIFGETALDLIGL